MSNVDVKKAGDHPRLREFRESIEQAFESLPWPQASDEEWRRSDISIFNMDALGRAEDELLQNTRAERKSTRFVSLNDALHAQDSGEGQSSLAPEAIDLAFEYLNALKANPANRLILWNLLEAEDIFVVYFPQSDARDSNKAHSNATSSHSPSEDPLNKSTPSEANSNENIHEICWHSLGEDCARHLALIVLADDASDAQVLLRLKGMEGHVQNMLAVYALGNNARLNIHVLQESSEEVLGFYQARAVLGRDSQFNHFEGIVGAGYIKNRVEVDVQGAGSTVALNGLYLAGDDQHIDLRTVQRHSADHAESRALYKGVVQDEAEAIFQGLIEVKHEAPGTDAYLTNNVLLLSDEAKSDSIPSLNIKTDDVKCSHGSTTGRINEEHIFYFQTRGYSRHEAMEFLVLGFFDELIATVPETARERFRGRLQKQLNSSAQGLGNGVANSSGSGGGAGENAVANGGAGASGSAGADTVAGASIDS